MILREVIIIMMLVGIDHLMSQFVDDGFDDKLKGLWR